MQMRHAWPGIQMRLDAIIFDFDGVLVESNDIKSNVFRQMFVDFPEHVDDIVALHHSLGGVSRMVKFDRIYGDILRQPLSAELREDLGARFESMVVEQVISCPMVPGALEAIDGLKDQIPMIVVS